MDNGHYVQCDKEDASKTSLRSAQFIAFIGMSLVFLSLGSCNSRSSTGTYTQPTTPSQSSSQMNCSDLKRQIERYEKMADDFSEKAERMQKGSASQTIAFEQASQALNRSIKLQ